MSEDGTLSFDAYIRNTDFKRQIDEMERRVKGMTTTVQSEGKKIQTQYSGIGGMIGGAFAGAAIVGFINKIKDVRSEFQQLEIAFKTMLGSQEKATKLMSQVTELAAKTPFTLTQVADGTKRLLAFQVAQSDVIDTVKRLGDVSAGVSVPIERLILAFGQVKAKGKLMGDDMRQFTEAGIPLIHELAKVLRVEDKEIGKMVEDSKVGFEDVRQVIMNLTDAGGMFYNMMSAQSKTLNGQISNLQDAIDRMFNSMGQSSEGIFYSAIKGATYLVENYKEIGKILTELIAIYGSYKATIIAIHAVDMAAQAYRAVKGYLELTKVLAALSGVTRTQIVLNSALNMTNPVGWISLAVTAITGLTTAYLLWGGSLTKTEKLAKEHAETLKSTQKSIDEEKSKIDSLVASSKNENLSKKERLSALNKLKEVSGGYLDTLTLENLKTKEGAELLREYNKEFIKKIKIEANQTELAALIKREREINNERFGLDGQSGTYKAMKDLEKQANSTSVKLDNSLNSFGGKVLDVSKQYQISLNKDTELLNEQTSVIKQQQLLLNEQSSIEKEYTTSKKGSNEEIKRTPAVIDAEIKALKEQQDKLSENSKQYQDYTTKIKKLEAEKAKITGGKPDGSEAKAAAKEELQTLDDLINQKKSKYALYYKWLEAFGKESADTQFAGLISEGDTYAKWIESQITYLEGIKKKTEVEKQQLEKFRDELQNAKDSDTQAELDRFSSTVEKRLSEYVKIEDQINYLKSMMDGMTVNTDAEVNKKLIVFQKLSQLQSQQAEKDLQQYEEDKRTYASYEDEKARITKEYTALINKFEKDGYTESAKLAKDAMNAELYNLAEKFGKYRQLYENMQLELANLSKETLTQLLAYLNKQVLDTTLPQDIVDEITKRIKEVTNQLDSKSTKALRDAYQKSLAQASKPGATIEEKSQADNDRAALVKSEMTDLQAVAQIMGDIAGMGQNVNKEFADIAGAAANIFSSLSQAHGVFANADASFIDTLTSGIGVFGTVVNLMQAIAAASEQAHMEKLQKPWEEFEAWIAASNRQLQEYIKLRDEAIGKDKEALSVTTQQAAKQQLADLEAKKNQLSWVEKYTASGWFTDTFTKAYEKAAAEMGDNFTAALSGTQVGILGYSSNTIEAIKSLSGYTFEEIQKLIDEGKITDQAIIDLVKQYEDTKDVIDQAQKADQELWTQTTAENISDAILQGLEDGKRGIYDFAQDFNNVLRKALLEAMQRSILDPKVQEWYNKYYEYLTNNVTNGESPLTADEIANLREFWNTIILAGQQAVDGINQIMPNLTGETTDQMTGAIKSVTEETANLIAGQMNAIRINQAESLTVVREQLLVLNRISYNTAYLIKIYDALTAKTSSLSGTGLKL